VFLVARWVVLLLPCFKVRGSVGPDEIVDIAISQKSKGDEICDEDLQRVIY